MGVCSSEAGTIIMTGGRWPAFRHAGFTFYWLSSLLASFAVQISSVSVAWQVYDITRDPFDLGLVGLIQFTPAFLLVLVTGAAADRFGRRTIMAAALLGEGSCATLLLWFAWTGGDHVWPIFLVLAAFGISRAFFNPASSSLVANLVPAGHLANAIALSTTARQIATIAGPVAGGLLYGLSATTAYSIAVFFFIAAGLLVTFIPRPARRMTTQPVALQTILAGFSYIWREPVVLGAISLDLFAVLLGGAVALMPVYARDILDLGPWGLGLLRAAPGVGAILVGFWLAFHPLRDHAGIVLLVFVGLFGLATAIFGLSTTTWISILALLFVGGCDMVSVYIRETMIQIWTPDALRGRVNAVNMVFVGASNELGEFRAGAMAAWIGTVAAVSLGGIATLSVALLWARLFPDMRRIRHLDGRH